MRFLLIALLLLAAPVAAQPTEFGFGTDYHARIAVGDVPLTEATEADGLLNTVEYLRFAHDGNQSTLTIPTGYVQSGCTCNAFSTSEEIITVGNTVEAGEYVFWVLRQAPAGTAFAVDLPLLAIHDGSAQVNLYAPAGKDVTSAFGANELACTTGTCTIYTFTGDLTGFWASVHPSVAAPAAPVVPDEGFGVLELVLGLLIGAGVWFFLVQKGMVQARTRKQVVAKAAHEEVAATESKEILGARKRVLMAGLKELEMAKMKSEVDDATYDKLKAELKREAVTTMRALES
ncbi:MAG: hypothetical protein ACPHID_00390 [Thermoplasmatota archaeon]